MKDALLKEGFLIGENMKGTTVVKLGSELVADEFGILPDRINNYARGLVETYLDGGLVVVTSGAVMAGKARVIEKGGEVTDFDDVTLAQLGSAAIVSAWERAFEEVGVLAGGLLTTHNEIDDSREGPSLFRTINLAEGRGVVSVINENDALSDRELMRLAKCEDNDGLSAHIAVCCGATALKIFTKRGGIVDSDGEIIKEVNKQNYLEIDAMLWQRKFMPSKGRGGIYSKFTAAVSASQAGVSSDISMPNEDMTGDMMTRVVVG